MIVEFVLDCHPDALRALVERRTDRLSVDVGLNIPRGTRLALRVPTGPRPGLLYPDPEAAPGGPVEPWPEEALGAVVALAVVRASRSTDYPGAHPFKGWGQGPGVLDLDVEVLPEPVHVEVEPDGHGWSELWRLAAGAVLPVPSGAP